MTVPTLSSFRRIVVKVGSSLLVDQTQGEVKRAWLAALADDIAELHGQDRDVLVVSSGSIALGRSVLNLPRGPLKLEDSQAAAAVGQIALASAWSTSRPRVAAPRVVLPAHRRRRRQPQQLLLQHRMAWR